MKIEHIITAQCDGRVSTEFGTRDIFFGIRDIVLDIGKYEFLVLGTLSLLIIGTMSLIPKTFSCYYQAFTFKLELIEIDFLQVGKRIDYD